MSYCVGLRLNKGLVFMSDTRTNAGVDNFSTFQKMFNWSKPGERCITVLTAGNLATTQTVIRLLDERINAPANRNPSVMTAPSIFQIARMIGQTLRDVIQDSVASGQEATSTFDATIILGGQMENSEPKLFLIYPEGNFIEASEDTPYFQSGETKYGRPILVRAFDPDMSFEDAIKLLMVSFDSTIKANLSVGLPLDVQVYEKDSLAAGHNRRIEAEDPYYQTIANGWGEALKEAFQSLPNYKF
ncbi:MAG: peptidase [Rhodospirillaceae bacterium TMED8]|nr:peptidase [Magnetovibrio sp.]OUT51395.1 MAG: peptidase [Rhodospirillaceae bacterium TMED8]|tara:strand:+ start:1880 stop:2611 length:732 start_codon:yes stop_codon:yes gene_type:complete